MGAVYIASGMQFLLDAQQRWVRAGHPVYLRIRNFPDLQAVSTAIQLGFATSPTGTATGTTDILIDPPPSVTMIQMTNLGKGEGKLRFAVREFLISGTFVNAQVAAQSLTNQDLVFRGSNVLGLYCDNQLFSIEDIKHYEYGGVTVNWILRGQAPETIQPGVS